MVTGLLKVAGWLLAVLVASAVIVGLTVLSGLALGPSAAVLVFLFQAGLVLGVVNEAAGEFLLNVLWWMCWMSLMGASRSGR